MTMNEIQKIAKQSAERLSQLETELTKVSSEKVIIEKQLSQKIDKLAFESALFDYVAKVAGEGLVGPGELKKFAENVREFSEEDINKIAQVDKIMRQKIATTGKNDIGEIANDEFAEEINKE